MLVFSRLQNVLFLSFHLYLLQLISIRYGRWMRRLEFFVWRFGLILQLILWLWILGWYLMWNFDINIIGTAFFSVSNSAQCSHLNPSITPGNHHWSGAAPLFNKRGVQMITGVYRFLSIVNRSSVNVFISTVKSGFPEASTCTTHLSQHCNICMQGVPGGMCQTSGECSLC